MALWLTVWWLQSMLQRMISLEMACLDMGTMMFTQWMLKAESYFPSQRARSDQL
jgi:hypothetical protein